VKFLFWSTLFAIAYTQSPLFTSNQNQYFLHGLAAAGYGNLHLDWLANTLDPTPLFSALVAITFRWLHFEAIYYAYAAMLMGIYLFSLLGIAGLLYNLTHRRTSWLVLIALIFLIHSAGLRFGLSRLIGANWTYVLEDGVADQRMLGPVLQPSSFGVLLALSVYLWLRNRPYLAVLAAALAATFHPTYLLSAALLTLAYMGIGWMETRSVKGPLAVGSLALAAVTPMLIYVYTSFGSSAPDIAAQARAVLVEFRIPHHALASQWFDATAVVKLALVVCAILILGSKPARVSGTATPGSLVRAAHRIRLQMLIAITALALLLLSLTQVISGSYFLALAFPWRLSILLVPLAVLVLLAQGVSWSQEFILEKDSKFRPLILLGSTLLIFICVFVGGIRLKLDLERKAAEPERGVQAYVAAHQQAGDVYLIPVKMQDFRLVAGAPVFVEFKSIPYRDPDVLEWYRREKLAERFYTNWKCDLLNRLGIEEGVTHVVLPEGSPAHSCPALQAVYQDESYSLYRLAATAPAE